MRLEELNLPEKKISQLNKKKLYTTEDVKYMFPRKYIDYRQVKNPNTARSGEKCIMVGTVMEIKSHTAFVEAVIRDKSTFKRISVKWFRQPYKKKEIENLYGLDVAVCGTFKNDEWGAQFVAPDVFTTDIENALSITPIYSKVNGMSNEYYLDVLNNILENEDTEEVLSPEFIDKFSLIGEGEMILNYHRPKSVEDIQRANKKMIYNRLYKVAKKMVMDANTVEKHSSFKPRLLTNTNKFIEALPYELTKDQQKIVKTFVEEAQSGHRVNALVQGDVGSGKTVCAFLIMFAMADNGYQSVLMAPTGVLAKQHYAELSSYAEKFGYKTVYLGGDLKAKEKKEVIKLIKDGEATFVVGTHSVISEDVEFKNLALTIVDEEHKFGVIQRETLKKKAAEGVHSVSMSATPIPRSLALTLYGDAMDIFTISTMPNGRLPVKTAVVNEDNAIFRFMQHEIEKGHQCYIVCPLIGNDDVINDEDKEMPESVDEVYKKVCTYFQINNPTVKASVITGKMKDEEKSRIIDEFSKNKSQILIATTIIEVGVNVPNATVITIMNAERFGLAGLHQLRGRVGRNSLQSYCMLKSNELHNERLSVMCETTNGFEIAEQDLKLRGTGDFLGTKQSGEDENVKLMLKYPQIYEEIRNYVRDKEVIVNETLKL